MDYTVKEWFWQLVDHWQTLIAGSLAVLAAIGTIWATIKSANREIAAAQAQTSVAQSQIATTLRIEQRRNTREAWAFYVTLEAAMEIVSDDVAAARAIFQGPDDNTASQMAYEARQRIRKSSFTELRTALLRLGGQLTGPFLSLDNKIDNFAAQWIPARSVAGLDYRTGRHTDLIKELEQIDREAKLIREEAGTAIKRCLDELKKDT